MSRFFTTPAPGSGYYDSPQRANPFTSTLAVIRGGEPTGVLTDAMVWPPNAAPDAGVCVLSHTGIDALAEGDHLTIDGRHYTVTTVSPDGHDMRRHRGRELVDAGHLPPYCIATPVRDDEGTEQP